MDREGLSERDSDLEKDEDDVAADGVNEALEEGLPLKEQLREKDELTEPNVSERVELGEVLSLGESLVERDACSEVL